MPRCPALLRSSAIAVITTAAFMALLGGPRGVAAADQRADAIDAHLRAEMEASAIPGLAVVVVKDGAIVHSTAIGVAGSGGRPMTLETPVVIGSVGKSITALAVRQLVAAGRLDLDAPVRRYLPWLAIGRPPELSDGMTVASLLEHTSGLSTADGQDPRWYVPGLTPEAIARSLASVALESTPGRYAYSNLNYVLLGVIIEAVSGQAYGAYVADHVFGPLGMRRSFTTLAAAAQGGVAEGHRYLFGVPFGFDEPYPDGVVPAGYQVSTAEDMGRFVGALAAGGVWGGVDIITGSTADSGAAGRTLGTDWRPLSSGDAGAASGQSGSTLSSNADILVLPGRHLGIVVLINANPTQLMGLPRGAAEIGLDVLRLSMGSTPSTRAPTVRTVYLAIDSLLVILAVLLLIHAVRARSWPARFASGRRHGLLVARTVAADLALPVAVLVGVPLTIGISGSTHAWDVAGGWRFLFWTLPDLGLALLALSFVPLAIGAFKLWAVRGRRGVGDVLVEAAPA
jgi:CubicO group peptidase (beta-lactamase class C family)